MKNTNTGLKVKDVKKKFLGLVKNPDLEKCFRTEHNELRLTDLSFADFFVGKNKDVLRFNSQAKKWYVWNGTIWEENKSKLHKIVKHSIKEMYRIAIEHSDKERDQFLKFCKNCENKRNIDNMLCLASRDEFVNKEENEFDKYSEFFNCNNVLIDLSGDQFKIKKHDPDLLIRQISNIEYNESAKCPKFIEFLKTIFDNDEEMIKFLHQAVGYSLTGDTSEDCLFFMYGLGRNGKSTLAEILKLLFGKYYHKANIELIIQQKYNNVRNDIADLKGKRLVITSEIENGKRLAENLIKDLTGGDDITARHLFQEHFTFKPTFTLWIYGNHKPTIRGTDEGIKRRIKLIPFEVTIPEDIIKSRKVIISDMKSELSGILNWALEGFNIWRKNGKLIFPEKIQEATNIYFSDMDHVQNFLNDVCQIDPEVTSKNNSISVKDLFQEYEKYCNENGEETIKKKQFDNHLKEKGFITDTGNGNKRYWKAIKLKS